MSDTIVFLICLLDDTILLFLAVYYIITLSDLECDYINATTCCSRLNKWIIPEIVCHVIEVFLLLISFHWIIFLLTIPMTAWIIYHYVKTPSGNIGVYDAAEIHNRQLLKSFMKEAMVKLGHHLVFFFIFLYSMIITLLSG
ncbi:hypothetical protein CAPTEDRAFT_227547 [Capitella teleta]|uniref:Cornichon n=1 Tax=Capitella teleta TaxID=283909 RepID=R7UXC3_CAPTE|nr:hypothetical protein CAPTEDRAFT_227547 [Capitella teleta]|eukprot:ELU11223.1 hypothetical protein CAPTEDRAFT_227547 [Capitella teleta]